jgi:DNA excision repair protein ERCC-1
MIKVNQSQRGNNLLQYLVTATWHYDSMVCADYEINSSIAIAFLSLKFHACRPEYIYKRLNKLKNAKLEVLMVLLDVPSYNNSLQELYRMVPIPIVACKSYEECARYIKAFESNSKKSTDILRKKESTADTFIESFPKINKSNVVNIKQCFSSIQDLFNSNERNLANLHGMGKTKADLFIKYLNMPFKTNENSF